MGHCARVGRVGVKSLASSAPGSADGRIMRRGPGGAAERELGHEAGKDERRFTAAGTADDGEEAVLAKAPSISSASRSRPKNGTSAGRRGRVQRVSCQGTDRAGGEAPGAGAGTAESFASAASRSSGSVGSSRVSIASRVGWRRAPVPAG